MRRTVISLLPLLAKLDPQTFASHHLSGCMTYLLNQLKKDKERSAGYLFLHFYHYHFFIFLLLNKIFSISTIAFISIGSVAIAMGNNINTYLDQILLNIKDGLTPKG